MRLLTHRSALGPSVAALVEAVVVDLNPLLGELDDPFDLTPRCRDVADVFRLVAMLDRLGGACGPGAAGVERLLDRLLAAVPRGPAIEEVELCAPVVTASKVLGVGMNFRSFVEEADEELPSAPVLFHKTRAAISPPRGRVELPDAVTNVVPEGELAVVIGRRMRAVDASAALDHVAGFTCANDMSARNLEFLTSQWTPGKMIDGFCPLGPVLVTPAAFGPIDRHRIRTWHNGRLVQDALLDGHHFPVPELLSWISRTVTLEVGDVVLTGTPSDLGLGDDPIAVRDGDVVEVEIDGIGRLETRMARAASAPQPG